MGQDEKDTEVGVVGRGRRGGWELMKDTGSQGAAEAA